MVLGSTLYSCCVSICTSSRKLIECSDETSQHPLFFCMMEIYIFLNNIFNAGFHIIILLLLKISLFLPSLKREKRVSFRFIGAKDHGRNHFSGVTRLADRRVANMTSRF